MMNVFFVIGDTLVTPPLSDSILDGVTRDSLLTLAAARGMKVEERPVSVKELEHVLETGETGSVAIALKNALDVIRYGRTADRCGWNYFI